MRDSACVVATGLALVLLLFTNAASGRAPMARAEGSRGWRIPVDAATLVSPLAPTEAVLAKGRRLYESRCERCHGPAGKGNGPHADPDNRPGDLADPARAGRNPDGVIYYKVWNGRQSPKMPAFKTELTSEEAWAVVHYVKTLRQ